MRKVRDYDAELKALEERARGLKARRIEQLGTLVTATGADALDLEMLAGALLDAVASNDTVAKEAWHVKGAAFFQRRSRKASPKAGGDDNSRAPHPGAGLASDSGTTSD